MKKQIILTLTIVALTLSLACNKQKKQATTYTVTPPDSTAILVADSIIYSVVIKNPDSLDAWKDYTLRHLDREKMIKLIFQSVYDKKLTAYSYKDWLYNEKVIIPPDSIKRWEKQIGIDRIGKVEFVERWFYSPETNTFYKQVLEMTFGYELYYPNGEVRGYAPVFKVSFNPADNKHFAK